MKPAAVLVGPFEVHDLVGAAVDHPTDAREARELGRVVQHEGVGRAGIEPHVEDVPHGLPSFGGERSEEAIPRAVRVPGVGAFGLERRDDAGVDGVILEDLDRPIGLRPGEDRDRHTPGALARHHPVGPVGNHAGDAVLAGGGDPAGLLDGVEREGPQGGVGAADNPAPLRQVGDGPVHGDEPLRRVAEDDRLLGAPGMRVRVLDLAARHQRSGGHQGGDDRLIGIPLGALVGENALALETWGFGGQRSIGVHRVGNAGVDVERLQVAGRSRPQVEVFATMARRRVDEAGARLVGDVVAVQQGNLVAVVRQRPGEGMGADARRQHRSRHVAEALKAVHPRRLEQAFGEAVGQHVAPAHLGPVVVRRLSHLVKPVGHAGRESDRPIGGNRPGRRRPDHHGGRSRLLAVREGQGVPVGGGRVEHRPVRNDRSARKRHEHRVAGELLVFHLGLGQGGLLHHAPHHRLGAPVQRPVGGEGHDLAGDPGLGRIAHRGVGMGPVADHPEPLELLPLHAEPMFGKGAALLAELIARHVILVSALGAVFFLDLPFDR